MHRLGRFNGLATSTDRETGRILKEVETFQCGHCQRIKHVPAKCSPYDLGGHCRICDTLICPDCVRDGRCTPFEKKLDEWERRDPGLEQLIDKLLAGEPI